MSRVIKQIVETCVKERVPGPIFVSDEWSHTILNIQSFGKKICDVANEPCCLMITNHLDEKLYKKVSRGGWVIGGLELYAFRLQNNIRDLLCEEENIVYWKKDSFDVLTQLGHKYNTDKATFHRFTPIYDRYLSSRRNMVRNVMEIGIDYAFSLYMWKDYFPNAQIDGLDIEDKKRYEQDRVRCFIADQTNRIQLNTTGKEYDLIIDDGGHTMDQQQISLGHLFSYVKPGGIYILEDIHTSAMVGSYYIPKDCQMTTYDLLRHYQQTGEIKSQYITMDEKSYLESNIEKIAIWKRFRNPIESVTAVIWKKAPQINLSKKICCIYAYYERCEVYRENLSYFLETGIEDHVDYYLVINGKCTAPIPTYPNLHVFYRENRGMDFGAYSFMISRLTKQYDYYFFLNTSVRGPFVPSSISWSHTFLNLFSKDVKVVGTSINIFPHKSFAGHDLTVRYGHPPPFTHVQSMFFGIDREYFLQLMDIHFFDEETINQFPDMATLIVEKEIGLSQHALSKGWNLNCMLPLYRDHRYQTLQVDINPTSRNGDPYYHGAYFGKTIEKEDVIFWKNARLS